MNSITPNTIADVVEFKGETYLCYKNPAINIALIRGTTADEYGNISLKKSRNPCVMSLAMAAKACGGKVIAQVKRLAKTGSLHPHSVLVPGIMVDAVVVDENQSYSGGEKLNPALTGK